MYRFLLWASLNSVWLVKASTMTIWKLTSRKLSMKYPFRVSTLSPLSACRPPLALTLFTLTTRAPTIIATSKRLHCGLSTRKCWSVTSLMPSLRCTRSWSASGPRQILCSFRWTRSTTMSLSSSITQAGCRRSPRRSQRRSIKTWPTKWPLVRPSQPTTFTIKYSWDSWWHWACSLLPLCWWPAYIGYKNAPMVKSWRPRRNSKGSTCKRCTTILIKARR